MASRPRVTFDLMTVPGIGRFLRWRHARTVLALPLFLLAALIVIDGLTGPQLAPKNLSTVLTWVHYRGFLVLALLVGGNLFCMACPFMLPRNLARHLFRPTRIWPRRLRNKWTSLGLFALLLFAYELFDLWATPWWTAWLIVGYFVVPVLLDSLFQGAVFCKYVCPLGQFNFVASLSSPLEVKVADLDTCSGCRTKDCIKGQKRSKNPQSREFAPNLRGCELWLFQERKVGNMDCTFCMDCAHACPHRNVGLIARLPASELLTDPWRSGIGRFSQRSDLAGLVIFFTFGALLNAFGMISLVYRLEEWLSNLLGTQSEGLLLGLIFIGGLVIGPSILLGSAAWVANRWAKLGRGTLWTIVRYAFALAPLGFGVWIAHYAFHFLTGFWTFVPVIQGALADLGVNILGAPRWELGPLFPVSWLTPLQQLFIGVGWLISLIIVYRLAGEDAPARVWQAFLPWATILLVLVSMANWLMGQPMEMRGTFFG